MGASKYTAPITTIGMGRVKISGSFAPAGTGAVTDVKGKGFSVARTGVGSFTITFDDKYPELVNCDAFVRLATPVAGIVVGGAYVAASKTLIIEYFEESAGTFAAADITADADNVVNFEATFRNTSIRY